MRYPPNAVPPDGSAGRRWRRFRSLAAARSKMESERFVTAFATRDIGKSASDLVGAPQPRQDPP
jgi:hypothetical protein